MQSTNLFGGLLKRLRQIGWLCWLCWVWSVGWATGGTAESPVQPLEAISRSVEAFLRAQHTQRAEPPQIRLHPLDPRLRLSRCQAPLEAFLPSGSRNLGSISIGVRCPDPPWIVYQRVQVTVYDRVAVANHSLPRGTILRANDIRLERRELSGLFGGYVTDPEQLFGKQLRQALLAGAVISPRAVKIPPAVRQGQIVTLIAGRASMQVTSQGTALQDAGIGERVRVRNDSSGRVVEGTVLSEGQVAVGK